MAKILVADDNSNIQKMVGLALKDQGIDVVAVGNGEAAVRKISDLRPDLVLADVFMPVRNGYEVCQYVKMDASLAHIPVILLVGAFDPLDEQEAQRVGADGVLKKPFVPPDPLISMVKSALQRAGVAHTGALKVTEPEVLKGSDLLTPSAASVAPIPIVSSIPVHTVSHEPVIAALEQESFVDEVPVQARPEPVQIDSSSQPVAFGSLLETPGDVDEKDDELGFLPKAHPELAPERDWRDTDTEELDEEAEEEKPPAPWRREEAESYADSGTSGGSKDWRSGSFEQILARKAHGESWEPVEEKPEAVETAPAASNYVAEAPAPPASIPEPPAVTRAIPSTPFVTDGWADLSSPPLPEKTSTKTPTAVEEVTPMKERERPSPETSVASAPEASQAEPQTQTPKESWFSVPSNPWNAELEKANRLASTWDSGAPVAAPPSSNGTEKATEVFSETAQKVIEEAALPAETVEAIREEAAQVAEDATLIPDQQNYDGAGFYAHEEAIETPASTSTSASAPTPASTQSMDDLVAKVLAKMNPEVLQAVTREILKPVVEAMVKEELKSKKP